MSLSKQVAQLKAELAEYKRRELDQLRHDLAEARAAVEHYKTEAQRNAETGRQIAAGFAEEVERLRVQLSAHELPNQRPPYRVAK